MDDEDDHGDAARELPRVDTPPRRYALNYGSAEFVKDASQLTDKGEEACGRCSLRCGLQYSDLMKSFWYFLAMYFAVHGCTRAEEHILDTDGAEHHRRQKVLRLGLDAGAWVHMRDWGRDPIFDTLANLCVALDGAGSPGTQNRIGKQMLLVCTAVYCSSPELLKCVDKLRAFAEVKRGDTVADAATAIVEALRLVSNVRTDVGAGFQTYGGRRRTFGRDVPVTRDVPWKSRYMDNLFMVLPMWTEPCQDIAKAMIALAANLRDPPNRGPPGSPVTPPIGDLAAAIMRLPLLGRPDAPQAAMRFDGTVRSYFGKQVLRHVWYILATLACECRPQGHNTVRPRKTCKCGPCVSLRTLRNDFTFFGPSPVALFVELGGQYDKGAARLAQAWRTLRGAVQSEFNLQTDEDDLDLLTMQSLPCIWRVYARSVASMDTHWVFSNYRRLSLQIFEYETRFLTSLFFDLRRVEGGVKRFAALSPQGQREVLKAFQKRDADEQMAGLNAVTPAVETKQRPITTAKRAGKSYASLLEKCEADDERVRRQ
jgi:hypothetical protein